MGKADETIKRGVIDQLNWDDTIKSTDINVDVLDDTVKLRGTVNNYTAKRAAERDAYYVMGVSNVENNLRIKNPEKEMTDEEITDNVSNLLLWNSDIVSNDINVQVNEGVVSLNGRVESYWEKRLSEDLAASATGVVEVINKLEVHLKQTYVDDDIRGDIEKAFRRNPAVDDENIKVEVKEGVVKLSGVVRNYQVKHQAHKSAQFTAGVKDVVDKIAIM